MFDPSLYLAALIWLDRARQLIPIQPRSKRIVPGFGPYQKKIADPGLAHDWWGVRRCNIGLLTGHGLIVLDFDDASSYEAFLTAWPDLAKTFTERTRRGFHVYLAGRDTDQAGRKIDQWFKTRTISAEVKSEGSVVTVAPSIVGSFKYTANWGAEILQVPAALSLSSESAVSLDKGRVAGQPGDTVARVKAAWPILDYAGKLTKLSTRDGRWYHGLCPLHDEKHPSFYVDIERRRWGCYSCKAFGDVINLYARVNGLHVQEAITKMAMEIGR